VSIVNINEVPIKSRSRAEVRGGHTAVMATSIRAACWARKPVPTLLRFLLNCEMHYLETKADSSICIATVLEGREIRVRLPTGERDFSVLNIFQTYSGVLPAYPLGNGETSLRVKLDAALT
jgi:hypothetical protein